MKKVKSIEVKGNSVEEAIAKALQELKLPRSRLKIERVADEKNGLFGIP